MRIGIIGTGGIATNAHIPHYIAAGADVVAVMNRTRERGEAVARQFGIERVYDTVADMLANEQLDAVSVCTPNALHKDHVIEALDAGCHVLCEKPPAISEREADEMLQAAKRANRTLHYGFHFRYRTDTQLLKRLIDSNELGHIYAATALALRRRGIPGWGVFTDKELQGGGALLDIGVHMLDLALYLMDYPKPVDVVGHVGQYLGTRPGVGLMGDWDADNFSVEDTARAMVTFENGASLFLDASFMANIGPKDTMNVELRGTAGGASLFPLTIHTEEHGALFDKTPAHLTLDDPYATQIRSFLEACRREPSYEQAEQAVLLHQIIDRIYSQG
ncbi:oxidoreductase [Exiguobacterium sp. SH31]|uniref:Gfo/Idh/MocA family protein n=1 Tax=unclassified Exiguobacterium TaxID=2644629 RepID=UPI0008D77A0D|nr:MULTISPECIES: Gfo/Idh/MocA family oxidoreductase [unclassified Exiguobacterium]OGX80123.1 oxidoreductase [Exiguobacterium sp. SH31]TCI73292.1 Gfo/Idh/MocA family oxidoreductase [Exiguobacterium sp. SH0S7]